MLSSMTGRLPTESWPELPWRSWTPTVTTFHLWLQVVGRIRMVLTPRQPHWAHVLLQTTTRGFGTGPIPFGERTFTIDLDVIQHRLEIAEGGAITYGMPLAPMSVAAFYRELMAALNGLGIEVSIPTMPAEHAGETPFEQDEEHASYDPDHARAMWRGFATAQRALDAFREEAADGWTPARVFWGSLDLATSRFSEDPASQQTVGWWPTSPTIGPAFYAYTTPEPDGYRAAALEPEGAAFDNDLCEFILTWDSLVACPNPDGGARAFLLSTARAGRPRGS